MFKVEFITTVHDVDHTDGKRGSCYALVTIDGDQKTGAALTIKRARELQEEGVVYIGRTDYRTPDTFTTWFGPDFPYIGRN
jgi:hypothetical protein